MTEVTKKLSKVYAFVLLLFVLVIGSVPAQAQIFYPYHNSQFSCSTYTYVYWYSVGGATSYKVRFLKGSTSLQSGAFEYRPVYRTTVGSTGNFYHWVRMPCERGWGSSRIKVNIRSFNSSGQQLGSPFVSEYKFTGNANIKSPPRSVTARPGQGITIHNAFEPGEAPLPVPSASASPNGSLASAIYDFSEKPKRRAFSKERFNQCIRMRTRAAKAKVKVSNFRQTKIERLSKRKEIMKRCRELSSDSSLTPVQIAHASSCGGTFCLTVNSVDPIGAPFHCVNAADSRSVLHAFSQSTGILSWTSIPNECRGFTYFLGFEAVNPGTSTYETESTEFRAVNALGVPPAQLDDHGGVIIPNAAASSPATSSMGYAVDGPRTQVWADASSPRAPLYHLTVKLNTDSKLFSLKELRLAMGDAGTNPMKLFSKVWYSDSITLPSTWTNSIYVQTYLEDMDNGSTVPQIDLSEGGEGSSYRVPFGAEGISARWLKLEFGDNSSSERPFVADVDFFGAEAVGGGTALGTEIPSCAFLQGLNNPVGNYYLAHDLNCQTEGITNFQPVSATANVAFVLNGNGHSINNLNINRPAQDSVGLFSNINQFVTIQNLIVNGSVVGRHGVGLLYGGNFGDQRTNKTTLQEVYVNGSVSGGNSVGGMGGMAGGNIIGCGANVTVSASGGSAGGLFGTIATGDIYDSFATGTITSSAPTAGGLIGTLNDKASISRSYAQVTVTATMNVGGLIGSIMQFNGGAITTAIADCYSTGSVTATHATNAQFAGGLIGQLLTNSSMTRCYSAASVTGKRYLGGLVGGAAELFSPLNLFATDSFAVGTINDTNSAPGADGTVGALIGYVSASSGSTVHWLNSLSDSANTCVGSSAPAAASASCSGVANPSLIPLSGYNLGSAASPWVVPAGAVLPVLKHSL